jgi:hypothetical protein
MKTIKKTFSIIILSCLLMSSSVMGQDDKRPEFVIFTTDHWNFDLTADDIASPERWDVLRKEFNEKVQSKNEYLMSSLILNHLYTTDNSEAVFISTYSSWANIELAQKRRGELIEAGWPDEAERKAFMDEWDQYYTGVHSDEIYRTIPGAMMPKDTSKPTVSRVVYIQKQQSNVKHDGNSKEFDEVRLEYAKKVIHNLPGLIAYYPLEHAWGSDNRDMIDIFILESLADVEAMNKAYDDVIEKAWSNEDERKAFFDKYDKYYTGHHADYLYRTIPMN